MLKDWWTSLEPQWKKAFNEAILGNGPIENRPTEREMQAILDGPALRFAGPGAPFSNMSFELTNLSGLAHFSKLETLVIIFHQLEDLQGIEHLTALQGLFVYNCGLHSLNGIEKLSQLEQLYASANQLTTIEPIRQLTNLKDVQVAYNLITSLEGITSKHTSKMKNFICLPNDDLPDREIIRVENRLGIRCRRG
ncbi:MAG: hypothetical protein R2828_20885 [Saprospiraceae bacterium]